MFKLIKLTPSPFKRIALASTLLVGLSSLPLAAQAGAIFGDNANSTENLGDFTGSLLVDPGVISDGIATLTVVLTNTSPAANGGFLTSFVLNNPGDAIDSISAFTFTPDPAGSSGPFSLLGLTDNGVPESPFGDFDFGAEVTGQNQTGLGVGESGTFEFILEGPTVDSLTQALFETALSSGAGGGGAQFFVARFQSFLDDGSDKVPAIPIPPAVWLLGSGLIGLIGIARRGNARRNRAVSAA